MFGIWIGSLSARNGRPTPWNRPSRVELALGTHMVEHLFGRKIVDLDDEIGAQLAETVRQTAVNIAREHFELGERRRFHRPPGQRIGRDIGHAGSVARIVGLRSR